jgi:outer membrane protein OmpA-like peptidoglycan-associated protein
MHSRYSTINMIRNGFPLFVALAAGLTAGCAPKSYIVLLKNPDGTTGRVVVTGTKGMTAIDQADQGAALDGSSATPFPVDANRLQRDFSAALAAQPVAPKAYLLYFDTGGVNLTAESAALLPEVLAELGRRPSPDVSVTGHTDTAGDAAANEALGLTRANQVRQLLQSSAPQLTQIEVTSDGERNLLVPTPDNTAELRNRRVEITVR